ncbi:MAG: hydrogenase [Flammeovirgaceae bacterium]|nr:hydrogenase [Flammeovirgaceae bacterium]MBR07704.1 hydrogenase [Rickettsiales bacterium]|tara:strand:- start:3971 stop:4927 length:957 start_codon:yes stop_codon:yes gene_type:complete
MDKNQDNKTRRGFLDKGVKIGAMAAVGSLAFMKIFRSNAKESTSEVATVELMSPEGTLMQVPASEVEAVPDKKTDYNPREGFPNRKFVMVVDLAKCRNARKCQSSCNKNHYITGENAWIKIYKMQETEKTAPYWQPTLCQHCDQPPCVKVCPVDATFKRRDGIVLIDNNRCIGCRFCMAACPYSVRIFNWSDPWQGETAENTDYSPDHAGVPAQKGTVDKCDFCPHMIDKGELPHCVSACPNDVFSFGDMYEDAVTNGSGQSFKLSKLLKDRAGYRLMESLGTEPSVYYLPPSNRVVDFEEGLENYTEFKSVDKTEKP